MLLGRRTECQTLDQLLADVQHGRSRVLVLRGEAGVGKSALLDYVLDRATACRVVRASGVESEMELAFAGLHQLCAPMLAGIERLPGPQRDALGTAFGLRAGEAPDGFAIGLATLSLLSDAATARPLLCLVDDAHWLDRASAQTLAFVARRLLAESVALVLAARTTGELSSLPELAVEGLEDDDARALLRSALPGPLDMPVRERIVAETGGNPLALLELPRGLSPDELAGGFGLPEALPVQGRIEETFQRRLEPLAPETRQLLLLAAAEPVGDPVVVWRAAARLGVGSDAAAPAVAAGLLELGARVRFRHPLVRSAVYRAASLADRQAVHAALADDPQLEPDRRAWHHAHATTGFDEDVAKELERSAERAQARGGLAAAAAFLERAVGLTTDPARRTERALAAAQAKHQAGAPKAALALLAVAEMGPLDELQRARVELLNAQVAFAVNRGGDAPPLLLKAAKRLESLDVTLARETYLDALSAATFVGRLAEGVGIPEVARAARGAPPAPGEPRAADLLLDGLALEITEGYAAGAPVLERALTAFREGRASRQEQLRWLWLAAHAALDLWDAETWYVVASRHVEIARHAGALAVLPTALNTRVGVHLNAGEFAAAAALLAEVKAVAEASGSHPAPYVDLALAAFQGREDDAATLLDTALDEAQRRGEGIGLTIREWAAAVLYNGLGRYEDALDVAGRAAEHPEDLRFCNRALVELIEAAVRTGDDRRAVDALARLSESTRACGTELGVGTEARSRALVSEGDDAERLYREAIDRLSRSQARTAIARARLLYGEWLRRERRRLDAREQLRTAHELFATMGMNAFAARAERELLATGETARRRTVVPSAQLTGQETHIARLAIDGLSNPEIGARLFISPRTVEYHLRKVFAKLGISSRSQLGRALPGDAQAT